jgi:DeoR/GlpR family transcriptional regulator of sugar metabolism
VVLADHTKLGVDTMVQTVAAESITHLVTDDLADPEVLDRLRAVGVRVHVARVPAVSSADGAGAASSIG